MERKDYIMKMIEDFFRALAAVIFNRSTNNYTEAKEGLDGLSRMVTGLGVEHLKSLGASGISYVFGKNGETETEKIYCSAKILKEDGLILESEGNAEDSLKSFELSLELFKLVSARDFPEKEEALKEIQFLKNKITEHPAFNRLNTG